jgi:hypothetical protein
MAINDDKKKKKKKRKVQRKVREHRLILRNTRLGA